MKLKLQEFEPFDVKNYKTAHATIPVENLGIWRGII